MLRAQKKVGVHLRQESGKHRAAALGLDGQRTGGKLQRPAAVRHVAAVPVVQDARRTDHRVAREVELFNQVEDTCPPMMLRPSRVEEDGLELSQFCGDPSHLCGAQAVCIGKDGQAVAAIRGRGEDIDQLELHRYDGTAVRRRRRAIADEQVTNPSARLCGADRARLWSSGDDHLRRGAARTDPGDTWRVTTAAR